MNRECERRKEGKQKKIWMKENEESKKLSERKTT